MHLCIPQTERINPFPTGWTVREAGPYDGIVGGDAYIAPFREGR